MLTRVAGPRPMIPTDWLHFAPRTAPRARGRGFHRSPALPPPTCVRGSSEWSPCARWTVHRAGLLESHGAPWPDKRRCANVLSCRDPDEPHPSSAGHGLGEIIPGHGTPLLVLRVSRCDQADIRPLAGPDQRPCSVRCLACHGGGWRGGAGKEHRDDSHRRRGHHRRAGRRGLRHGRG